MSTNDEQTAGTVDAPVDATPVEGAPIETTPVTASADLNSALVAFFQAITARENVDAATIKAAADQHAADQATIDADNETITADQATIASDEAALATAQANAVSPQTIATIDAATNALNSGTPLPTFP